MSTKKQNNSVILDNCIHATVEHKRGVKKPKVSFGFVAKGLLLTGAFLIGITSATTVHAKNIDADNFTVQSTSTFSQVNGSSFYTTTFDKLLGELNDVSAEMDKNVAKNILSAKYIQDVGIVLAKMENAINNGAIITDENSLIDALKHAEKSVYLDTDKWGTEFGRDVLTAKEDVESKIGDIYTSIGYDAGTVGQVDLSKTEDKEDTTLVAKLKTALGHLDDYCVHYKNAQGMVFEDQVKKNYDDALKEGLHTETCLVNLSSLYKDNKYVDVKSNIWYFSAVKDLYQVKLMQGESSDRFNPNGNITIAQTIAVASRIHALYETGSLETLNSYSGAKWYSGVEKYALEKGIIKVGDFSAGDMNKPATRAELSYILDGALPQNEITGSINNGFSIVDVKDLNSKVKYVDTVVKHVNSGIITGYEDGSVKPNNKITRAEACVIIDRLVRPTERVKQQKTEITKPSTGGRVVYVQPRTKWGTQYVYDKPGSGLTPIKAKYGRHVYLSNNQQEYDYVMKVVEEMFQFKGNAGKTYKDCLDNWNNTTYRERMMKKYKLQFGNIPEKDAFELYKIEKACQSVGMHTGSTTKDGVDSAYELLSTGYGDCTADAMSALAVMDFMGYNAKTVANDSQEHEWAMVEVNGKWLHLPSGDLRATDDRDYNRVTTPDTFNNAK